MRKNIIKFGGLLLMVAVVMTSCDFETAKRESAAPISPDDYPVATYTTDFSGTAVTEGDTISYTITVDKMLDRAVTFQVTFMDGTGNDHEYEYEPAVLNPYTLETSMDIVFVEDDLIEPLETVEIEVAPTALSDKYLINPSTDHPLLTLDLTSVNQSGKLTINMDWNNADDNDFGIWSELYGQWSANGASSHQPEYDVTIWDTDDDDTFYVCIWDWGNPDFEYTLTFATGEATNDDAVVATLTGTFSSATAADMYDEYLFYGAYPAYAVAQVVKSGTTYTVTAL